jgi:hypothetical protein
MRCPACGAEIAAEARRCPACGERTARKPRRREPIDDEGPFGDWGESRPSTAQRAYRCAVYSLIPLAGLVLGPVAIVLALLAWREGRRDPEARDIGHVLIALLFGLVTLLCHGAGLVLIVMALTAP